MKNYLYTQSDNTLRLNGVQDRISGSYLTTATASATIKGIDGSTIATVTLAYAPGAYTTEEGIVFPDGNYTGNLPASIPLVAGSSYIIVFVTQYAGYQMTSRIKVTATDYTGDEC